MVWCMEHGSCLGISVMRDKESPRIPFEVLYTRWPQPPEGALLPNSVCRRTACF